MSDSATVVEPSVPSQNRPLVALALLAGICATIGQRLVRLPVHPAETAWLVLLGAVLLQAWRQGRRELPALPWLLCLAMGTATAGIAGAGSLGKGLTEWGQLAVQVGVPILILRLAPGLARPLTTGLVLGLTANTMVAMAQRSSGLAPVAVGGLLGSRMLLAGVCGVLAPFAFRLLGLTSRLRLGIAFSVLVVATVALPQAVLVIGLFLLLLPVCRSNRLAWALLLGILLLAVAVRWQQFADFARLRDPDGTPRRWVQETIAAREAVHDRPLTGHGFGRFQSVVSSAEYRGELPRPLETKVEPGRQAGYAVLAVEAGLPAALLLAATLLTSAWLGVRRATSQRCRMAAWACGAAFVLLGVGSLLVRGPGFIVGSVLALASTGRRPRFGAVAQGLFLAVCLGLACAVRRPAAEAAADAPPVLPAPEVTTVLLQAAEPVAMPAWAGLGEDHTLAVPDGVLQPAAEYAPAVYRFSLSAPATLTLWLRASWHDGCGNSIAASIDDAPPRLVGNDGSYHTWHWVRGFQVELAAGEHELKLHPREDGLALDQFLLTEDAKAHPSGRLGAGGHALAEETAANQPLAPLPLVPRTAPFRFGIGGCYRGGFEAALLRLGLPWGKVNDCDLDKPEVLKTYTVLCLSELKEVDVNRVFPALEAFVRAGGVLVWENHNGWLPDPWRNNQTLLPFQVRRLRAESGGNSLKMDDSFFFTGMAPGTVIEAHDKVPVMRFWGQPGKDWTGYGRLLRYGRDNGAAFYERSLDQGNVYFLSLPLSFHTMWKGRQFLDVLASLLTHIAGDACPPLHPQFAGERPDRDGAWFGDDFMRTGPDIGGEWTASGNVRCTGEDRSPLQIAFSAQASAPAELTGGNPEWSGYRLSSAVRSANGTVALRAVTETGQTIQLVWEVPAGALRLELDGQVLLSQPLPPKAGDAWRQLSLFGRDHTWFGFADGQCYLRLDSDRMASLTGRFTLAVTAGEAYFDDVAVCPVAQLLPDTDRAMGEEGSPAAWGGLGQHGIERYTVYAMPWLSRASASQQQAVELVLPTYRDAVLRYDASPGLRIPGSVEAATLALPEAPQRWLAVEAPAWHDYVFPDRLTEWTPSGGNWIPLSRWSCDPEWHWVGTETNTRSALWYDHELAPPYAVNAVLSLGARDYFGEEYTRGRDLNLQVAGDGSNLDRGFSVRVMNARDRGVELWRDGQLVAQAKNVGMPSGHTLHHNWYEVAAWVEADRIRVRFEGVTVIDQKLEKPAERGRLAVWTERNSIRVARITVAGGR